MFSGDFSIFGLTPRPAWDKISSGSSLGLASLPAYYPAYNYPKAAWCSFFKSHKQTTLKSTKNNRKKIHGVFLLGPNVVAEAHPQLANAITGKIGDPPGMDGNGCVDSAGLVDYRRY